MNARDESLIVLALNWARAFDSISPERLIDALERFGLPGHFVEMVGAIYSNRAFFVNECCVDSSVGGQAFGISQGCPLSPYLFVILMSVIMTDVHQNLQDVHGINLSMECISELLYADDTLIVGAHPQTVEKQLQCIVEIGREYGMEMNWQKVEMMTAKCESHLSRPDGNAINRKMSLVYLGALVGADGGSESELARRIGLAQAEFNKLQHVWGHSSLTGAEKYEIYVTCVVSRLLYGLQTMVFGKAARQKLDGFHARCARKIAGIQPSYWSRISNTKVLEALGARTLTSMLLEQQLSFFGKLARRPMHCPVRQLVFEPDLSMKMVTFDRRRGRPKLEWSHELHKIADEMFESAANFRACVACDGMARICT